MKIANGLFIACIGLVLIMFSPVYGKNGAANMAMLITGIIIILFSAIFIFYRLKKGGTKK